MIHEQEHVRSVVELAVRHAQPYFEGNRWTYHSTPKPERFASPDELRDCLNGLVDHALEAYEQDGKEHQIHSGRFSVRVAESEDGPFLTIDLNMADLDDVVLAPWLGSPSRTEAKP